MLYSCSRLNLIEFCAFFRIQFGFAPSGTARTAVSAKQLSLRSTAALFARLSTGCNRYIAESYVSILSITNGFISFLSRLRTTLRPRRLGPPIVLTNPTFPPKIVFGCVCVLFALKQTASSVEVVCLVCSLAWYILFGEIVCVICTRQAAAAARKWTTKVGKKVEINPNCSDGIGHNGKRKYGGKPRANYSYRIGADAFATK